MQRLPALYVLRQFSLCASFCVFYCHRGSHVAMSILLFYLCFSLSLLLLFQGHVTFRNSTLTGPLHYMALHCITSATTRPHPPSSYLACIAGGILGPGVLSQRPRKARSCKGKHIDFIPTLLAALSPKQYSTPTLIPPATQATCSSHPSTLTPFVTTTLTHRSHLSPLTRMNFQPSPSWNNKLASI